jgi:hypothetical protein
MKTPKRYKKELKDLKLKLNSNFVPTFGNQRYIRYWNDANQTLSSEYSDDVDGMSLIPC